MKRRKNPFPGVSTVEDRHGKFRHRLRRTIRGRTIDTYLPGPYGSPAFRAAYEEVVEGTRVATRRARPGTVGYLVATYLVSAAFRNLAPATRAAKRGRLDWIREAIGQARYAALQPRHVEALMEKKGGPEAVNRLKKDMGQLFRFLLIHEAQQGCRDATYEPSRFPVAVPYPSPHRATPAYVVVTSSDLDTSRNKASVSGLSWISRFRFAAKRYGFAGQNPAALADTHKVRSQGFHTWTDDEVETFGAAHPIGSKARLALELFLGTGAACQDAAAMTRANIRGPRLSYRRGKTGQEVDLPILPELGKELAHLPRDQMMLLAHGTQGKGYTAGSLSNVFRDMCAEAGLNHCSAHGLRKAGARRLAEHAATEWEVMAFLAHRTAKEASRYTAAANRAKLTTSGMAKLGADHERILSNLSERLDKRGS